MKPLLAATTDGQNLRYPLLASPKLDGIRAVVVDGVVLARSLKPVPNRFVQNLFGRQELNGLDGELVVGESVGNDVFNRTSSGVMSIGGEPEVKFHVFDDFSVSPGFETRLRHATKRAKKHALIRPVQHTLVSDYEQLMEMERLYVGLGYEGLMLRDPLGPYKHGRSTLREGWLLKLKRFKDSEAEIIGFVEQLTNTNEAKINELGYKERSSKRAGKVPAGVLGAFVVRDTKTQVEFELGTGFTAAQRHFFWSVRDKLMGRLAKYKSQEVGAKNKPRLPVFLGFRHELDL